jgi:hypothetical protein
MRDFLQLLMLYTSGGVALVAGVYWLMLWASGNLDKQP